MTTFSQKMQELRRILKLHANWLLYATVGESALTTLELAELREYGKLPMDSALDLVDKSYFLGRMRSTQKTAEYKKVSEVETPDLSPIEDGALEATRTKSIVRLKRVADDAMSTFVVDTSLVGNKKAVDTKKKIWSGVVRTEFQTAKVQGIAQTIANKSDFYENSGGPDSNVSVIPARSCCDDCRDHYLDADGNPYIFRLSDLMSAESNADVGVVHTKTDGRHPHWKTTLPPLHPNCGCLLVYVPPGHGWADGKLSLLNKSLFLEHLSKATAGVQSAGISATVAPTGAPSVNKPAGHPSVPGAAAPGNVAGPGRPSGLPPKPGSGTGGPGGGPQLQACAWAKCPIGHHKPSSATAREHAEIAARNREFTPQAEEAHTQQMQAQADEYNKQAKPAAEVHDHLTNGEISSMSRRGKESSGVNASFTVTIAGNGSGLMKPKVDYAGYIPERKRAGKSPEELKQMISNLGTPGNGTIPDGMNPRCEAAAYERAASLGIGTVPVTTTRYHDGENDGPVGLTSVQQLKPNVTSVMDYVQNDDPTGNAYENLVKSVPKEHKDKVKQQLQDVAVLDAIWNNNDRHWGNLLMTTDTHDVTAIDHGTAFANGLSGHRNDVAFGIHRAGEQLKINPQLYMRLKNESLESTMRATKSVPAWMKGQTFLRQQYMMHLQDTHGHIPFQALRGTIPNGKGDVGAYSHQWVTQTDSTGFKGFYDAEANNQLPHQQFEGWAKEWMQKHSADESSPHHADAKRLMEEIQPLRSHEHVTGSVPVSKENLQKHFDSIPAYNPIKVSSPVKAEEAPAPIRTAPDMPTGTVKKPKPSSKQRMELASTEIAATVRSGDVTKSLFLANPNKPFPEIL